MDRSRYVFYNPNPHNNRVGDCAVRAVAKATGEDWEKTYSGLSAYGFMLADMPNANHVWGAYLRKRGFERHIVDDGGRDFYTVDDFCADHPVGVYVLAIPGHVVCVESGRYFDSWDSGQEVPQYYWQKV